MVKNGETELPRIGDDPDYWLGRARQARGMADQVKDSAARRIILQIARAYERLAERVRQNPRGTIF